MRFTLANSVSALCVALTALLPLVGSAATAAEVEFNRDIRPILVSHCFACHGGVKQAADLSFVYPEKVLPPEGWVIEPGDPDASEVIARVTADDPEVRMPPPDHGPALTAGEIDKLRTWIERGAQWQRHWAFEPPVASPIPPVSEPTWPRSDLDYFVLGRLDRESLLPSADAEPYRWLRRVSLDLVGLPPTPEELAKFLADVEAMGDLAYEEAVDRLLDSEHFGERWASVWLDQVRYADSMGLGLDDQRTIWKYRDWVIRALNDDLPYDQFTIKQMAGDLLPDRGPADIIATAGHRLTQTNGEGGTDDEEFRTAAVLDRVNTTWQTWQGITFGCVQCHSHPYEPFEHSEYYQFAAFFNNTADCDLSSDLPHYAAPVDPADYDAANRLDRRIEALRHAIWQREYRLLTDDNAWSPLTGLQASTNKATKIRVESLEGRDEYQTSGSLEQNTDITLVAPLPEGLQSITAIRLTGLPHQLERAEADSEWGFVWSLIESELAVPGDKEPRRLALARVLADEAEPLQDPQESLNAESSQGYGAYSRINHPRMAALVLQEPVDIPAGSELKLRLNHRIFALGAFSLVVRRGHVEVSDDPRCTELLTSREMSTLREQFAAAKAERKQIESVGIPILRERPDHLARPTHVFDRGLFLTKGKRVEADVPDSLPPLDASADRLALAHWLVDPDNPLTARVAVNRIWSRLFGTGIVETEEDFGSSGEPPSHPELLDHLAVKFQRDLDWSVKQLLRELVLSRTYRQSSRLTDVLLRRDPGNRLLARGPRHRLPAETIRDQALAVSGLLHTQMYGPPLRPPLPDGVWKPFAAGDKWPDAKPGDPARYRRSIYTYIKRTIPYPVHATFDQPSREFCAPRRLRSNTPLQALELLNSEVFDECATALADRMQQQSDNLEGQVAHGFTLAVSRQPTDVELAALRKLATRHSQREGLVAVAKVLLNLDEFLMK